MRSTSRSAVCFFFIVLSELDCAGEGGGLSRPGAAPWMGELACGYQAVSSKWHHRIFTVTSVSKADLKQ